MGDMKLVIDTDVLYAGLYSKNGASRQVLNALWPPSEHEWLISVATLLEYEAVLKREQFLMSTGATIEDIDFILNDISRFGKLVGTISRWRPITSDPNDDHVAETAVYGHAKALITFNKKDFSTLTSKFKIAVLSPKEWLERNTQ